MSIRRRQLESALRLSPGSLAVVTALAIPLTARAQDNIVFQQNFDAVSLGTYTEQDLHTDWPEVRSISGIEEGRATIVESGALHQTEDVAPGHSLQITYPQGESNHGKSEWRLPFAEGHDELFLSFRLRFDEGFNFVRGGKLPGFSGGEGNVGGNRPDGTDGFSARMMWRTDGSSGAPTTGETANIVQYIYHPDQPRDHAEDFRWDDGPTGEWQVFEADTWYHVQHRLVMNTPGQHDGIFQAWLDGELVLDLQDLRFRDDASIQINELLFSTFFGGSSERWETTKIERAYFDDFVVSTTFIEPSDPDLLTEPHDH